MAKVKREVDQCEAKRKEDPKHIEFDLITSESKADQLFNDGESMIHQCEKMKDYPSLNGVEANFDRIKVHFDSNFEHQI